MGERQDGTWYITGLKNADKKKRNFWNTIHDTKKVSINLLSDKNVESYEVNDDTIILSGTLSCGYAKDRDRHL